jgi:hypothetical protein
MDSGSFFIQTPGDARRHVEQLTNGLKKVAFVSLVGGLSCSALAIFFSRFLAPAGPQPRAGSGLNQNSGVAFAAWCIAIALLAMAGLYLVASWGLGRRKSWARYTAAATFSVKVLLCLWLGRAGVGAMIMFLFLASWDFYGLWVLLAKETGQLFASPQSPHPDTASDSAPGTVPGTDPDTVPAAAKAGLKPAVKPANLVT